MGGGGEEGRGRGDLAEATKHEIVHCALKRNANNKTLGQSRGRVSTLEGRKEARLH